MRNIFDFNLIDFTKTRAALALISSVDFQENHAECTIFHLKTSSNQSKCTHSEVHSFRGTLIQRYTHSEVHSFRGTLIQRYTYLLREFIVAILVSHVMEIRTFGSHVLYQLSIYLCENPYDAAI